MDASIRVCLFESVECHKIDFKDCLGMPAQTKRVKKRFAMNLFYSLG